MRLPFATDEMRITSPYGKRILNGNTDDHSGWDAVGIGTNEVVAALPGVVVQSRIVTDKNNPTWQWGNYVCIRNADGRYQYYAHLASRAVKKGQTVAEGDKLGIMGNTGYSFGAHLHFEVREADGKTTVSPAELFGLPNNTGICSLGPQFERDIKFLAGKGVINSPSYWLKREKIDPYFPDLIHKIALELK